MTDQEPCVLAQDFETSAEIVEFAKAFPKAQAAMGDVLKNANNPAFKSKYADLGAVVEATIPALNSNGFSVMQPPATSRDGTVRVMTMILHESGQWMRCTLSLRPMKADPQGVGSAITYGRRYGLQAMTGVAPEDDDGNAASRAPAPTSSHKPDLGPSPEGPDFWNCHEPGLSAYAAKKEGLDKVHDELRHAASEIPNRGAIRQFIENNLDTVRRMPRSWRVELRQVVEARAEELGPDGNERRAA